MNLYPFTFPKNTESFFGYDLNAVKSIHDVVLLIPGDWLTEEGKAQLLRIAKLTLENCEPDEMQHLAKTVEMLEGE